MIIFLVLTLCAEWVNKYFPEHADLPILFVSTVICSAAVIIFSDIKGISYLLVVPILLSACYYKKAVIIIITGIICTAVTILLMLTVPLIKATVTPYEIFFFLTFFTICTMLALGIMIRGMRMTDKLHRTMAEQQDLMVRNTVMESNLKIDALTGLYNHKTFHEYLDRLIQEADRSGLGIHLALLDIDNFKQINDTYGHWVGDLVLKEAAAALKQVISFNDFACRYGGEEFAAIFVDQPIEIVCGLAERIRAAIAGITLTELQGNPVTISTGVAGYIRDSGKEAFFRTADAHLYYAKHHGKNRVVSCIPKGVENTPQSG